MANNRVWLLHRPSLTIVHLGKRMGTGWYNPPEPELLQAFYDFLEAEHFETMDDFEILIEGREYSANPGQDEWTYDDFTIFKKTES